MDYLKGTGQARSGGGSQDRAKGSAGIGSGKPTQFHGLQNMEPLAKEGTSKFYRGGETLNIHGKGGMPRS